MTEPVVQSFSEGYADTEDSLRAAEALLGLHITIIDFNGRFQKYGRFCYFSRQRQSHQKNPVCGYRFCQKCIDHCRHEIGKKAINSPVPFLHQCWKGVAEIVVPLYLDGVFAGQLFAGQWHSKEFSAGGELAKLLALLPELPDEEKIGQLSLLLEKFSEGIMSSLGKLVLQDNPSQEEIIERFIRREYHRPVGLEDLAKHLGVSTSRASHLASQSGRGSFQKRLLRQRLEAARSLLLGGQMRINELSSAAGFNDPYYFTRVFKREYGCSPREFRSGNSEK